MAEAAQVISSQRPHLRSKVIGRTRCLSLLSVGKITSMYLFFCVCVQQEEEMVVLMCVSFLPIRNESMENSSTFLVELNVFWAQIQEQRMQYDTPKSARNKRSLRQQEDGGE